MWVMARNHTSLGAWPPRGVVPYSGGPPSELGDKNQVPAGVKGNSSSAPKAPYQVRRD